MLLKCCVVVIRTCLAIGITQLYRITAHFGHTSSVDLVDMGEHIGIFQGVLRIVSRPRAYNLTFADDNVSFWHNMKTM